MSATASFRWNWWGIPEVDISLATDFVCGGRDAGKQESLLVVGVVNLPLSPLCGRYCSEILHRVVQKGGSLLLSGYPGQTLTRMLCALFWSGERGTK